MHCIHTGHMPRSYRSMNADAREGRPCQSRARRGDDLRTGLVADGWRCTPCVTPCGPEEYRARSQLAPYVHSSSELRLGRPRALPVLGHAGSLFVILGHGDVLARRRNRLRRSMAAGTDDCLHALTGPLNGPSCERCDPRGRRLASVSSGTTHSAANRPRCVIVGNADTAGVLD